MRARTEKNKRKPIAVEDKLFLAMTHWRLGDEAEARKWFDEAGAELDGADKPRDRLQALLEEAQQLLGLKSEKAAAPTTATKQID